MFANLRRFPVPTDRRNASFCAALTRCRTRLLIHKMGVPLEATLLKIVSAIKNVIDIKARFLFGLWLIGGALIFLPQDIKAKVGLSTIPAEVTPWLGICTLVCFIFWLTQVSSWLTKLFNWHRRKKSILAQLKTLSTSERDFLIESLARNQRTLHRLIIDSTTHSLVTKGLLSKAYGTGNAGSWPFTIPSFVWEHISKKSSEIFPELDDEVYIAKLLAGDPNSWMRH